MRPLRLLAALPLLAIAPMPQAGVLYKSVDANGTVMFSDVPPPNDARIIEQRPIPSFGSGSESSGAANGFDLAQELIDSDAAVARASAQVDQAEHALALARRNTWSPRDGLGVAPTRGTLADQERIEFFKRGVLAARQQLMELLRERRRG
jgi:hypothetical protein